MKYIALLLKNSSHVTLEILSIVYRHFFGCSLYMLVSFASNMYVLCSGSPIFSLPYFPLISGNLNALSCVLNNQAKKILLYYLFIYNNSTITATEAPASSHNNSKLTPWWVTNSANIDQAPQSDLRLHCVLIFVPIHRRNTVSTSSFNALKTYFVIATFSV